MISTKQVNKFVKQKFNEKNPKDRITDKGFAFYINTQTREFLDSNDQSKMLIGNGPIVIVKATGEVYSFSSNPTHMLGLGASRIGVNKATTAEEFTAALAELSAAHDSSAIAIDHIG